MRNNKPTKVRFFILFMVFVSVVINYMVRSNLSIAGPHIAEEFGLSTIQMGYIYSAFGWTYALLQIPGGFIVDKVLPRMLYTLMLVGWSAMTLLMGIAQGFGALFGLRLAIGVFEVPAFPTNNKIVTAWFPEHEKGKAIACYTSGQFVGVAFLTPVLVAIQTWLGWQGMFILMGAIDIIWGLIWYALYRQPDEHKGVNQAEIDYIKQGDGVISATTAQVQSGEQKIEWSQIKMAFSRRKL